MKFFKHITTGDGNNAVLMGNNTFKSIGKSLPNRYNIVISHNDNLTLTEENVYYTTSIESGIIEAYNKKCDTLFIIGGASIYKQVIDFVYDPSAEYRMEVDTIYLTEIETFTEYKFDTYFSFDTTKYTVDKFMTSYYNNMFYNNQTDAYLIVYRRNYKNIYNDVDNTYIDLIKDVLTNGQIKHTRAGDTLSVFGRMCRFDLRNGLPILTSKKVYSKGCIHELLWFLKGDTNIKYLVENNTHIWDDDAYRYFLQNIIQYIPGVEEYTMTKELFLEHVINGDSTYYRSPETNELTKYTYGDLGPVYGKQWVDWNGVNQVDTLINTLKNNPDDRRMMISAWNVSEIKNMALPPCHFLSQWYTTKIPTEYRQAYTDLEHIYTDQEMDTMGIPKYYLSCMWSQRSVDTCLGLPYDLLSYSIFTHLIASVCNMVPYEVICSLGDTHVYCNQIKNVYQQLDRNYNKYKLPRLELNIKKSIYDYSYDDIKIKDYKSYGPVKYKLSVGL